MIFIGVGLRVTQHHCDTVMCPTTSKAPGASSASNSSKTDPSIPVGQKSMRNLRSGSTSMTMLSDALDNTSSDEMSFDEEDMYGSDPDVETITLASGSNQQMQSPNDQVV